jgi:biofilm PGA synthesis N-glycosyltransferase PgaC
MASVIPATRSETDAPVRRESAFQRPPAVGEDLNSDVYLPVASKFVVALAVAIAWTALSVWLSQPWLHDLADVVGWTLAILVIAFIAYVPGFMNTFLISTILLDRRPKRSTIEHYPDLSILVACFNEAANVTKTITSLALQNYPGRMDILILDDGSTDGTAAVARAAIRAVTKAPATSARQACSTAAWRWRNPTSC